MHDNSTILTNILNLDQINTIKELKKIIDLQAKEMIKQKKMVQIGEIASRLSHDLRNPLSVIMVSVENLAMLYGTDNQKQKHYDRICHSIDRIVNQVNNVLNYVKDQPTVLSKTKTSRIILDSMDSILIPNNVKINISKNDYDVVCDREQLSIVINNLVVNAIQAVGVKGSIDIRVGKERNWIVFEIEDSGNGISEENLPYIFKPLFTTKKTGTGFGLVSVKSVVESHGGEITVSNSPTIFKVKIPKTPPGNFSSNYD
ncbi:hypothetical protein NZNM25_01940 [Nitrosopumilus zosterae]|uniref:Histidine kinase domain-containing protein n=1 Tax=Nitrosopumilus zosterae TaxID=718286 RepID=A0A2S2KNZ1_9ARCH|nr:HAMP domain-containing sensor histidine kinase [Nitrosopumilus zosterae]BDQ31192.1 HAMP domain-containing histidine kinase [Nitrosopumilus zosterae]GBH33403.1 hypothetical protein NZNM25_01940 [Nitrosopumilus zosterae]